MKSKILGRINHPTFIIQISIVTNIINHKKKTTRNIWKS